MPDPLRRRHRSSTTSCRRCAAISTRTAFRWWRSRLGRDELLPRDAARSRPSLGALGRRLDRAHHRASSRRSCPISAARCPTTSSPTCSACRPIWVPHSYAGCSQHAPNEHLLGADRARGAGADGRHVLGSRRSGRATAAAPRLNFYSAATAAFVCCACRSISRRMRTACELSSRQRRPRSTNSPAATLRTSLT